MRETPIVAAPQPSSAAKWPRPFASTLMPGDYPTARTPFEAERAALLGTRSFYTPYAERLSGLDRRISRLLAAAEENSVQTTFEERAQWLVERDSWSDWAYS
jgi:hypothetical protein